MYSFRFLNSTQLNSQNHKKMIALKYLTLIFYFLKKRTQCSWNFDCCCENYPVKEKDACCCDNSGIGLGWIA